MPITTCTLNLRAKLLAGLAAIGLLSSCEDPTDIGVGIDPASEQIGVTFIDTVSVEASTLLLDSANTSKASTSTYISTLLVGKAADAAPFNNVSAEAYSELAFRNTAPDFSSITAVTSVELSMQCTYVHGSGPLNLQVTRLEKPLTDVTYYQFNSEPAKTGTLVLGTATITSDTIASFKSKLKTTTRKLTFKVDLSTTGNFFSLDSLRDAFDKGKFATNDAFRAYFKGLRISAVGSSDAAIGFGASGTLLGDSTFVMIKYKKGTESKQYLFNLSGRRYHTINPGQWGIPLAGQLQPTTPSVLNPDFGKLVPSASTGNDVFMQSGTGLRTYVYFPTIASLREKLGDIAINKAELIVPVTPDATTSYAAPPELLITEADLKKDASGNVTSVRIAKSGSNDLYLGTDNNPNALQVSKFVAPVGSAAGYYKIQLTTYLQSLLYGTKANRGLILFGLGYSARLDRARIPVPYTDPSGNAVRDNRMRLKIYYTRIK